MTSMPVFKFWVNIYIIIIIHIDVCRIFQQFKKLLLLATECLD